MLQEDSVIIVTGGAGFIGANIVRALNAWGHRRILLVDRLRDNGKWKNLVGLEFADYMDRDDFLASIRTRSLPRPDLILHQGACSSTTERDENFLIQNNSVYSKALFDYCAEVGARFIYASSAATYGDGSRGYRDTDRDLRPLNAYGYSKHLFDEWALGAEQKPPQWAGLKYFNVYGPYERHKGPQASVVLHGFDQIREAGHIRLFKSYHPDYADGMQMRDFVYVGDVVRVVRFLLDRPDVSGIFNVGTGRARSFYDLALATFRAMEREPDIRFIAMPENLQGRYQYFTEADMSSLRRAGFDEASTSLEDGVAEYVRFLQRESGESAGILAH
jgi:ADP-L-glycero-D-manno-heptose 6-epimerase